MGGIRLVGQPSLDRLAFLNRQYFSQVENSLFPMSVFGMWACREANRLVTCREINIEPRDKCVDEVISLATEREGSREREFLRRDCIKVDRENWARVGDHSFHLDSVN